MPVQFRSWSWAGSTLILSVGLALGFRYYGTLPAPPAASPQKSPTTELNEIFTFYNELNLLWGKSEAELSKFVESHSTLVTPTVNWLFKESIKEELAGNTNAAQETIKKAQSLAEIAYKWLHNTNAKEIVEHFSNWTPEKKRLAHKAVTLTIEGIALSKKGQLEQALRKYQDAHTIYTGLDDKMGTIFSFLRLGNAHLGLYAYPEALEYFNKAYELSQQIQEYEPMAHALVYIGYYQYLSGDYSKGLLTTLQAKDLCEKYGDKRHLATSLVTAGHLYNAIGHYEEAANFFKQALTGTARPLLIEAQRSFAETEYLLKNYRQADRILDKVFRTADKGNDGRELAYALFLRGSCRRRLGHYEEGLRFFKEALDLATAIRDDYVQVDALLGMGETYTALGRYAEALTCYAQMPSNKFLYPYAKTMILQGKGIIYERLGRNEDAFNCYRTAIEEFESVRSNLNSPILRLNYFESYGAPYTHMIRLLSERQRYEEAFVWKEKAKARDLMDSLLADNHSLALIAQDLAQRKGQAQAEISYLQKALLDEYKSAGSADNPKVIQELQAKLTKARSAYQDVLERIFLQAQEQSPFSIHPVDFISDIRRRVLGPEVALVAYHVMEDATLAWVLTEKELRFKKLPAGRAYLLDKITALRQPIEEYKRGQLDLAHLEYDLQVSHDLYKVLFGPLEEFLRDTRKVRIIPDDVLCYLSFEALVAEPAQEAKSPPTALFSEYREPKYLIDKYILSYASSANVLKHLSGKPVHGDAKESLLLAMGNPVGGRLSSRNEPPLALRSASSWIFDPLPRAEQEIQAIASGFKRRRIYVKEAATEEAFKQWAPQADIIHLATHGLSDDRQPLYSLILLAPSNDPTSQEDGLLQAFEIAELKLKAQLVVLSACDTGYGKLSKGEGILGFAHSFLRAGAKSALVSLWSVDDESTAVLMKYFYQYLLSSADKASALRNAKLRLLHEDENTDRHKCHANPLLWAPFILTGDPN